MKPIIIFISCLLAIMHTSYGQQTTTQPINNNQNKIIMNNQDYTANIVVEASPAKAYNAIKNFRAWWSEEIDGPTDQLNEAFFYHYKDIHLCKMKLVEIVENKRLVYQVLENEFNFISDKTEWVDTHLIFEIIEESDKTKVRFTHKGLVPSYECYEVCNDAWTGYITNSLYKLIETGKGEPNPKDKDGFNAELAEKWHLN
ncbi:SRPBCC domain-containing protein [Fulvivirga sp.]|uniref:SRPBCC family protein n=1 Tax=Fulvivirga sp. TaxID=1931237 RepID=UPI0032EF1739